MDGKPLGTPESNDSIIGKTDLKHKRFAKQLLVTGNATVAYQKVYPNANKTTARERSHELLSLPAVQNDIRQLLNYQGLTLERLNSELLSIIDNPVKEVLSKTGTKVKLKDNSLKLEAIKHGHKLHGVTDGPNVTLQDNRKVVFNQANIPLDSVHKKIEDIVGRLDALRNEPEDIRGEVDVV